MHCVISIFRYIASLVEDIDPNEQLYDAVTSVALIEHVADPEALVRACARLVKVRSQGHKSMSNQLVE